jgi:hypothetical protein
MATFSNNTEPKGVLEDVPAANQDSGSFGKKGNQTLPLDPVDDDHLIHKCDSFIGGKL